VSKRRAAAGPRVEARTPWSLVRRRFLRHRLGVIGCCGLALICLLVLAAPWVAPCEYGRADLRVLNEPPSLAHPMGTDLSGKDVLTSVLYGGRISLGLALVAGVLAALVGTAVGLASGYHHGRTLDAGAMGMTDFTLTLPLIPVVLVAGLTFGFSSTVVTLVLALLLWPRMARLVRAQVLSLRGRQYVEAARALGVPAGRIMLRHLLPNVAGVVAVQTTLTVAAALLLESALSYLSVLLCTWARSAADRRESSLR
jgi:peptide/nickel transport system permease protein